MIKRIFLEGLTSLFWIIVGIFISFILSYLFLEVFTKLFVKIGLTKPALLESMDALFFIIILSFLFTLLIQKQRKIFIWYNKTSTILLVAITIYLTINFISVIIGIKLPNWFIFPLTL